jgi:transcription factor 25
MVRLSQGLSMRPLEDSELWRKVGVYPGDKWWTVEHSPSYKSTELLFLETVQIGGKKLARCAQCYNLTGEKNADYQGFMEILGRYPWHIDSLLQMSEVARHQEGMLLRDS